MKIIYKVQIFLLVITMTSSCISDKKETNRENAITLNNKGIDIYFRQISTPNLNTDSLNLALSYLNESINVDSSYLLAYTNKVNIELKLKNYNDAIFTLEKAIQHSDSNPDLFLRQGNIYEKNNSTDDAYSKYQIALNLYEKAIQDDPQEIKNKVGKAYTLFFLKGKSESINELERLELDYPNNKLIQQHIEMIESLRKEEYLNNL